MRKHFIKRVMIVISVLLGLVLFSPSTNALSSVISLVQVGPSGVTNKEYVAAYNNTEVPVEVTGWCMKYGATSDTTTLGCMTPPNDQTKLWLTSHSYLIAVSSAFKADHPAGVFDITFASGTIASKDRYVRLVDAVGMEIDRVGWGTGAAEGVAATNPVSPAVLQRVSPDGVTQQDTDDNLSDVVQSDTVTLPLVSGVYEEVTPVDMCPNINDLQLEIPPGYLADSQGNCLQDRCQNTPDVLDLIIPPGFESLDGINCTLIPLPPPEDRVLIITELLPNADGTDTGKEFIELYNPHTETISLTGYTLFVGPNYEKEITLTAGSIAPGQYKAFYDSELGFTLINTSSKVKLVTPAGNTVSQAESYDDPDDNLSWVLIDGVWQYTDRPTPGSANLALLAGGGAEDETSLIPCPEGKFRNPETNRCKTIETGSGLQPCAVDQVRNTETNRCRSIFSGSTSLAPCQPGQTRNPETNRCRGTATTASAALKPCAAGQTRNPATNRCRKSNLLETTSDIQEVASEHISSENGWLLASGALGVAGGYGVWEWRGEVTNFLRRARQLFGKSSSDI